MSARRAPLPADYRSTDDCRTASIPDRDDKQQQRWSPQVLLPHARGQPSPTTGLSGLSSFGRSYHDCVKFATTTRPHSWAGSPVIEQAQQLDSRATRGPVQEARQPRTKRPNCANGDGYSWRKYGEKFVKGSPFPRSYYKCSHQGCPIKKIIERDAVTGHLYQTVSQGNHCHPPSGQLLTGREWSKSEGRQQSCLPAPQSLEVDWRQSAPEDDDANDTVFSMEGDVSSASGSPDCESNHWDRAGPQAVNWREAQQEAKRRRLEQEAIARLTAMKEERDGLSPGSPQAHEEDDLDGFGQSAALPIRQPAASPSAGSSRQILEVPLSGGSTDDGYRWRKYGQKMVKGNIHPRSYYKCTYSGCGVRKHVERSGLKPDRLLITYEGQHTHKVPDAGHGRSKKTTRASSGADEEQRDIAQLAAESRSNSHHLGPRYLSSRQPQADSTIDSVAEDLESEPQTSGAIRKRTDGLWAWPPGACGVPNSSTAAYPNSIFLRQAARSGFRRPTIKLPPPTPIPAAAHLEREKDIETASWDPSRLLSTPSSKSSRDDDTPDMSPANLRRLGQHLKY
ncbi:hypothetical protein WJX84_011125 [Apatococcus fuscideae]|uniref:WRKY domain-containing protein n=1 Tax=Apatococcus fuscideae TaxID=2026836 RepID=A0AAW1TIG1_9CHLO